MEQTFRYKAFISYRHTERDKKIAGKLQKKLESYKPPKGIASEEKWKIFRDETELSSNANLSTKIKEALDTSEYLIVICSESTKTSRWCLEEIDYFKSKHNGSTDNIIPLVAQGDPERVFPEALLTTSVFNEAAGTWTESPVEPLAANVSAPSVRESLRKLNTEMLRVAATMLSCGFDNLYLREKKRRRRRNTTVAAAVAMVALTFSVYSIYTMTTIRSRNNELEQKNNALITKTDELNRSNATYVFDVATGELIYKAHEDSMIEAAFSDNEHIFVNTGFDIKNIAFADGTVAWSKPAYEYAPDTDAFFGNLRFSKDFKRAALFDSSGYFLFLDTATGEVLYKINLSLGTSGFFFTNQCTDFSDGVHFTTVYYNEYGDSSNSWNICLDIENHTFTKVYNNRGSSILATRYVDNRTIASVENNNYLNPNDPEYGKTFINFIGLGGDVVRKVALDEYTISNVQIRAVFTTEDTDTPQTFVALSGITFTDKLPTVFFVNVTTGELIVRNLPSAVTQIGYRGTSGWVSVYTSQGAQYHYNILTDYSILGNVLTDSSVFSADGSRKLVWVSNNLAAALGKQSNRIMVYFSEESQAASTIPGDGNGFSRVTEGNDCIYSVSKTKLFVHDKNTKKERFRFNIDYSMGPSVVCRDSLYVLDNDADYIHIYNGENGEEYYINISGLSRYSVHYQHHTKI